MDLIPMKKVAQELGVHKDYALRLVHRLAEELGLRPQRGQRNAMFLSRQDTDRLVQAYQPRAAHNRHASNRVSTGLGYFYLIQLHPADLPNRFKIGYTNNMDVRLSDHKTSAPTLSLVKSWPCKRTWEEAARASITREACQWVGGEVFDGDLQGLLARADAFFSLMPSSAQFDKGGRGIEQEGDSGVARPK